MSKFWNFRDTYTSARREAYKNKYGYYPDEDLSLQQLDKITIVLPADVSQGGVVEIGDMIGVAAASGSEGDSVQLEVSGEHTLPKNTPEVFAEGQAIYWDGEKCTGDPDGGANTLIGVAADPAESAASTCNIHLNSSFA